VPRGKLAVVSSFGTESAALLKYVADVDRSLPVLFLDTGWLFTETLAYRDTLVERLGLTDVRTIKPDNGAVAKRDPDADLWSRDPDACCNLRKVAPLATELSSFDGWINGRKRFHGGARRVVRGRGRRLTAEVQSARAGEPHRTRRRVRRSRPASPSARAARLHVGGLHALHQRRRTRRRPPRRPLARPRQDRVRHPHRRAAGGGAGVVDPGSPGQPPHATRFQPRKLPRSRPGPAP
jgi:hypothetical protein